MKFYLGTHREAWLFYKENTIPLFISYRTLRKRKRFTPVTMDWALDSGGFSELSLYGKWTISPKKYVNDVNIYKSEMGKLDFAAIQDWMCEEFILKKTGKSIIEHQNKTIDSYFELKSLDPDNQYMPVIQGYEIDDYLRHIDMYNDRGIDLRTFNRVGVGSICRRQNTNEIEKLIKILYDNKINIHGFGVKIKGLSKYHMYLKSSDSLAWAVTGRYFSKKDTCRHKYLNCSNCIDFAFNWYKNNIEKYVDIN